MRTLILLFLIHIFSFVYAEKTSHEPLTRIAIIHENGYKIHCSVLVEKIKIKTELNTLYFWYQNDQIKSNGGGYSGLLLHGLYQKYDKQKNLIEEGQYVYGTKVGLWKFWNKQGEIVQTIEYKSGKRNGLDCIYQSAKIWEKSTYKSNQLHGKKLIQNQDSLFIEIYKYGKLVRKSAKPLVKAPKIKVEKKKKEKNKKDNLKEKKQNKRKKLKKEKKTEKESINKEM
nr:hypothetical protein [uncultured Marinifilum sp.]